MRIRIKTLRFIEFFVVGVLLGVFEDLLAVGFATDAKITPHVILVVLMVAVPFAFVSEYVVDHPRFWKTLLRLKEDKNDARQKLNTPEKPIQ